MKGVDRPFGTLSSQQLKLMMLLLLTERAERESAMTISRYFL
jgi:hypothetical protein